MRFRFLSLQLLTAAMAFVAAAAVCAQSKPVADGIVQSGEYSIEKVDGAMRLYASFDSNRIYIAAVGRTSGWIAVGVDSRRMDGAKIFMGYFANGKETFSTQVGERHRHKETTEFSVLAHAVAESNGVTTIEIVLDRSAYLGPNQTTIDVIYAMGSSDTFRQYHSQRGSTTLNVD